MFSFVQHRKIWYIISLLVIVPGLISLALQGLNLGIEYTGGNLMEVRLSQDVTINQVRDVVEELELGSARNVQKSGTDVFMIRTRDLTEDESARLITTLEQRFGQMVLLGNEMVSPTIGKELAYKAILALLVAAALMLLYITFRFEFKQGLAAVLGLLHNTFIVLGVFSIFQLEVDGAFVAAILTVIGYSINDTIIIFDRMRENMKMRKKDETLEDLVNVSLWQTLTRSVNTVLTVIFVLVALLLLGGATISNLILALLIGITSGVYASIFIASNLWYDLKMMPAKAKS